MVFLAAFALYWLTLAPTVWVGDSGELVAAAHLLGIPHPTGYPLWLLATKAFTALVPFGTVAWRANLFSALCAAAAAALLGSALRRLGAGRLAAFGGGLALAALGPVWAEATAARTYPLAALFSASMTWSLARFLERGGGRWIVAHNLLLGLGLANHAMVIAHAPVLLAVVAAKDRAAFRRPKLWAAALLAVLPGLLVYGYLPSRAAERPPLAFRVPMEPGGSAAWSGRAGEPYELRDLDGWAELRSYLSRDFHHTHRWARSAADHLTIAAHHGREIWRELTPLGTLLALAGAAALRRRGRGVLVGAVALLWVGNLVPLALHGAWWDLFLYSRYLTTGWVGVALLVGVGIDAATRVVAARIARPAVARAGAAAIALALPALLIASNWRRCDRGEAWLAEDYGRALLAELPPDAQFLSGSDGALYPLFTLHFVEGERPDVQLVSPLQLPGDPDLLLAWRAARRGTAPPSRLRPAFTPDSITDFEGLERDRRGLLYRLRFPQAPDEPRAPYEPPPIRGLERDDEPDPFARSLIGAIEADLADAAAARGDRAQARRRLERVVRLRCPRPWGNVTGIRTLMLLAQREAAAGAPALAREELELARELAAVALECGDPRDPHLTALREQIELRLQ